MAAFFVPWGRGKEPSDRGIFFSRDSDISLSNYSGNMFYRVTQLHGCTRCAEEDCFAVAHRRQKRNQSAFEYIPRVRALLTAFGVIRKSNILLKVRKTSFGPEVLCYSCRRRKRLFAPVCYGSPSFSFEILLFFLKLLFRFIW